MSPSATPDPGVVLELMNAFRNSAVLFSAVALGVFDRLEAEAADADTLARHLGTDADALGRLLDACVGLGLLRRASGRFENTPAASVYLCRTSPQRLTGYITYSDRVLWHLWARLADAIREGTHRWKQVFDMDGPIFSSFFRTEEDKREFVWGMHGFGQLSSPRVVTAFDLSGYRHLCDLGGATGHLAVAACRQYASLRATVFDLPAVVPMATERVAAETDVASRIDIRAGDFFLDELPPADLYAVGRIVHDWAEDKIRLLLGRIHAALPPGGALLVAEVLLDEDRNGPLWALQQSLNMLVCTEGKERTLSEYEVLLRGAGFTAVHGRRTGAPLDAILAMK